MGEVLLYVFLGVAAIGVFARVRSLIRPSAFPPWMTPILEAGRNPDLIMERSGLSEGECVLEIGPGAGYLTQFALSRIGPTGRLVCPDLQIEMLRKVCRRLGDRCPTARMCQRLPAAVPRRGLRPDLLGLGAG